jgi:DNA repair exonuclease SbcCD ATPase subunit
MNGAGKSLVLECISFAFFGNCALRASATLYKKLEVNLIFNYLNLRFKLTRKTSDAVLYIETDGSWVKAVVGTTPVNSRLISLFRL